MPRSKKKSEKVSPGFLISSDGVRFEVFGKELYLAMFIAKRQKKLALPGLAFGDEYLRFESPSTPMVAAAFEHLPIHALAGMVSLDNENVLKAIRHGTGTPVIQKFCKKDSLNLSPKNQEIDVK